MHRLDDTVGDIGYTRLFMIHELLRCAKAEWCSFDMHFNPQHGERQALNQGHEAIPNDHPSKGFLAYRNTDPSHVSHCMCGLNFGSGPRLDRR
jgi:hypothetical protein